MRAAGGGALLALAPFQKALAAPEFRYKYANNLPPSHPMNLRANEAAQNIARDTGGRFELAVFPSSQLARHGHPQPAARGRRRVLHPVRTDPVHPGSRRLHQRRGLRLPDYDAVWKAMDGELGAHVRREINGKGLFVMDRIWDSGFRQVTTSNRAIAGPDDFRDLKIRVPVSPLWTSMFKALGSSPASINFNETYSALQTRVVDAQENPLAIIQTAKLYEVQKYCSMTNHMWDGFGSWAIDAPGKSCRPTSAKSWPSTSTPPAAERADVLALNNQLQAKLAEQGLAFNTPQPEPIREALRKAGFYASWKEKYGDKAWALLEQAAGRLS